MRYEQAQHVLHLAGGSDESLAGVATRAPLPASSRWLPKPRPATTDLIHDLSSLCAAEGLSFFLLGGTEDVNRRGAEALARLYPGLRIAGRRDGYFSPEEEPGVCAQIVASGAESNSRRTKWWSAPVGSPACFSQPSR